MENTKFVNHLVTGGLHLKTQKKSKSKQMQRERKKKRVVS
jgi:hypothetical protein